MKLFQSQIMCMGKEKIIANCLDFYASDEYPNGGGYCYHDFIEIEFFFRGQGIHYLNGVPYQVCKGMCYLLLPGDYHYYELTEGEHCRICNIKLDVSIPSPAILQQLQSLPRPYVAVVDDETYTQLQRELELLSTYCSENPTPDLLSTNIAERVMILLIKNLKQSGSDTKVPFQEALQTVIDHVNTHYHQSITSVEMAKLTGLSTHYFSTYFKNHTGLTFCDYINRVRLFRALDLMETTTLSLKEIAFMVGFSSQAYFTRMFTRFFSVSPMQHRKNKPTRL